MELVDQVEAMVFDLVDGALLVPGVALERIVGDLLRRIDVTFEGCLHLVTGESEVESGL